jgi:hypothetical protein
MFKNVYISLKPNESKENQDKNIINIDMYDMEQDEEDDDFTNSYDVDTNKKNSNLMNNNRLLWSNMPQKSGARIVKGFTANQLRSVINPTTGTTTSVSSLKEQFLTKKLLSHQDTQPNKYSTMILNKPKLNSDLSQTNKLMNLELHDAKVIYTKNYINDELQNKIFVHYQSIFVSENYKNVNVCNNFLTQIISNYNNYPNPVSNNISQVFQNFNNLNSANFMNSNLMGLLPQLKSGFQMKYYDNNFTNNLSNFNNFGIPPTNNMLSQGYMPFSDNLNKLPEFNNISLSTTKNRKRNST